MPRGAARRERCLQFPREGHLLCPCWQFPPLGAHTCPMDIATLSPGLASSFCIPAVPSQMLLRLGGRHLPRCLAGWLVEVGLRLGLPCLPSVSSLSGATEMAESSCRALTLTPSADDPITPNTAPQAPATSWLATSPASGVSAPGRIDAQSCHQLLTSGSLCLL